MSKYIDQIIDSIESAPLNWRKVATGIANDRRGIEILGYGMGAYGSVATVQINGKVIPTSWWDRYHLERAIQGWLQTIPLHHLQNTTI